MLKHKQLILLSFRLKEEIETFTKFQAIAMNVTWFEIQNIFFSLSSDRPKYLCASTTALAALQSSPSSAPCFKMLSCPRSCYSMFENDPPVPISPYSKVRHYSNDYFSNFENAPAHLIVLPKELNKKFYPRSFRWPTPRNLMTVIQYCKCSFYRITEIKDIQQWTNLWFSSRLMVSAMHIDITYSISISNH